jgi:hypothetical protein
MILLNCAQNVGTESGYCPRLTVLPAPKVWGVAGVVASMGTPRFQQANRSRQQFSPQKVQRLRLNQTGRPQPPQNLAKRSRGCPQPVQNA